MFTCFSAENRPNLPKHPFETGDVPEILARAPFHVWEGLKSGTKLLKPAENQWVARLPKLENMTGTRQPP